MIQRIKRSTFDVRLRRYADLARKWRSGRTRFQLKPLSFVFVRRRRVQIEPRFSVPPARISLRVNLPRLEPLIGQYAPHWSFRPTLVLGHLHGTREIRLSTREIQRSVARLDTSRAAANRAISPVPRFPAQRQDGGGAVRSLNPASVFTRLSQFPQRDIVHFAPLLAGNETGSGSQQVAAGNISLKPLEAGSLPARMEIRSRIIHSAGPSVARIVPATHAPRSAAGAMGLAAATSHAPRTSQQELLFVQTMRQPRSPAVPVAEPAIYRAMKTELVVRRVQNPAPNGMASGPDSLARTLVPRPDGRLEVASRWEKVEKEINEKIVQHVERSVREQVERTVRTNSLLTERLSRQIQSELYRGIVVERERLGLS